MPYIFIDKEKNTRIEYATLEGAMCAANKHKDDEVVWESGDGESLVSLYVGVNYA